MSQSIILNNYGWCACTLTSISLMLWFYVSQYLLKHGNFAKVVKHCDLIFARNINTLQYRKFNCRGLRPRRENFRYTFSLVPRPTGDETTVRYSSSDSMNKRQSLDIYIILKYMSQLKEPRKV